MAEAPTVAAPGPLTVAAYARLRGVSHTAVQQRIKAGSLPTSAKQIKGQWMILDADRANAEWAGNTRPRFGPRVPMPDGASPGSLAAATLRERRARAKLIELDFTTRTGALVPVRGVDLWLAGHIVEARTAMLGLPTRAKLRLPHLTASDLVVLGELIREALEGLAAAPPWQRDGARNGGVGLAHEAPSEPDA